MYPNLLGQKESKRINNTQLASVIGVSRETMRHKLRTGNFTAAECKTLCKYFDKSFEYLFATNDEI